MKFKKHETSIIDEGAEIGNNTQIWHWSHICGGAKLDLMYQ
jgi:UDP-2-acetamido-3-amino-2,3-dideoxy-glucuronate N-acetyltransferase